MATRFCANDPFGRVTHSNTMSVHVALWPRMEMFPTFRCVAKCGGRICGLHQFDVFLFFADCLHMLVSIFFDGNVLS